MDGKKREDEANKKRNNFCSASNIVPSNGALNKELQTAMQVKEKVMAPFCIQCRILIFISETTVLFDLSRRKESLTATA